MSATQLKAPVFAALPRRDLVGVQLRQVAINCRVSTDDQSCERQERDLRALAKGAGHHIVAVLKEVTSGEDCWRCRGLCRSAQLLAHCRRSPLCKSADRARPRKRGDGVNKAF